MQEKQAFERIEVSRAEALEVFAENEFKVSFAMHIFFRSFISKYQSAFYIAYLRHYVCFLEYF